MEKPTVRFLLVPQHHVLYLAQHNPICRTLHNVAVFNQITGILHGGPNRQRTFNPPAGAAESAFLWDVSIEKPNDTWEGRGR